MKKICFVLILAGFALSTVSPAFAFKQLKDAFAENYAGEDANADFKKLVEEAKCNVCHVDKENKKKVRNPYGTAIHEALEKAEFPVKEFKKEPEKFAEEIKKIFKSVEPEASGDEKHKTFADRMKANLLPGGNVDGKKE
ncbi:MAG: hypothetical protein KDA72_01500 [Planctomycetales bacterium]|nr:hypothetical protein [Planctomycetales bacterium]